MSGGTRRLTHMVDVMMWTFVWAWRRVFTWSWGGVGAIGNFAYIIHQFGSYLKECVYTVHCRFGCWDGSPLLVRPSYVPVHPVPPSILPVPNVNSGIPTDTRIPSQESVSYRRNSR